MCISSEDNFQRGLPKLPWALSEERTGGQGLLGQVLPGLLRTSQWARCAGAGSSFSLPDPWLAENSAECPAEDTGCIEPSPAPRSPPRDPEWELRDSGSEMGLL